MDWIQIPYFLISTITLIPIIVGIRYFQNFCLPDKIVLSSLFLSQLFAISDNASNLGLEKFPSGYIAHFYPLSSFIVWWAAYFAFFRRKSNLLRIINIISFSAFLILIGLYITEDLNDLTTKGSFRTVRFVYLTICSLLFFYYGILNKENKDFLISSFFWYSAINLIFSSILIVLYAFFDVLKTNETWLYSAMYFNWFLIIASNLGFAYVFHALGEKGWSTDIY